MAILFLIYILVCYKTGLEVYWYDWVLFGILEALEVIRLLFSNHIKESYEKGLREGMMEQPTQSIFCELDDEEDDE